MRKAMLVWLVGWAVFGLPWMSATHDPQWHRLTLTPFRFNATDAAVNCLYYFPLGFIGARSGWSRFRLIACATTLSLTTEMAQMFSTVRSPDVADLLANVVGAIVGFLVAARRAGNR